ncbi:hypothetical protein GA830_10530 [Mesorhizobium sp. NBSH29]|uniref:hypothetical protein n=1 Tax=Mesorhizobium sp. NBSH29 TaxID=2654249 RepID=UPI00189657D2|nr:hypothetical protein [Mesorhizobium sp. NBSH29]QPC87130.1 hypothetical protein GA830_10530 [Mesorhizobium sp. NBSH29]
MNRRHALAALALAMLATSTFTRPVRAEPAPTFTLAQIAEDTYFDILHFTMQDIKTVIARQMTEAACIHATRYLNAWGSFTACIPESAL